MLTPLKPAGSRSPGVEKADAERPRARRRRPRRRSAADKRDELANVSPDGGNLGRISIDAPIRSEPCVRVDLIRLEVYLCCQFETVDKIAAAQRTRLWRQSKCQRREERRKKAGEAVTAFESGCL